MKLLLLDFSTYRHRLQGNLTWERIGKTPLVWLHETKPYSFTKSIAAHLLYKVGVWCCWKTQALEDDRMRVLFPLEWKRKQAELEL